MELKLRIDKTHILKQKTASFLVQFYLLRIFREENLPPNLFLRNGG
jgi:hypothetical protein